MKVPLSWLKAYIPLDQSPKEIAERMTMLGLEVEAIETFVPSFENVVVGKVVSCEKHPNAERLQIAQVTDGEELHQVVCGAPNCREGLKTAFCRVGGSLEEEGGKRFKIRKAKIRGVESFGMLGSLKELRLGEDHEGIMELPEVVEEGTPLEQLYEETVFDVSLTPNLGFAASMIGVARELAAAYSVKVVAPEVELVEGEKRTKDFAEVFVETPDLCPRYAARVVTGVRVAPSPLWMQQRLQRAGVRPINNIVDITNYVLLETGHPLHAFDLERLSGHKVFIRTAKEGETLVTLDEKERKLKEGFLLIADESGPVALAGVMGGASSEVTEETTTVFIESALFEPRVIRRASKEYALLTDAARRFQTGADPENVLHALSRAAALLAELAGGEVSKEPIDICAEKFAPRCIELRVSRANAILGTLLSPGEVESVFERLCYPVSWVNSDTLAVTVPTYRTDVSIEEDLIEEVARIHGFENIPRSLGKYQTSPADHSPLYPFERLVRRRLVAEGLQEMITCDLISPSQAALVLSESITEESLVRVMNPTSQEQSILRPSLLPGLLASLKYNIDRQHGSVSAFEVGKTHFKVGEKQYKEQSALAILLKGRARPHHWEEKPSEVDFFDLKGMCESLFRALQIEGVHYAPSQLAIFHPGRRAEIHVGERVIGSLGELHPALTEKLGIEGRVFFAEINNHDLIATQKKRLRMDELPQFPGSERDWTVTLAEEAPVESVFAALKGEGFPLLKEVRLRDLYRSERLGSEKKNVTLRFIYRDDNKTVSQEEVDAEHESITKKILTQLGKAVI